jgi:nucleoside-diphosphate-sugar epimerase
VNELEPALVTGASGNLGNKLRRHVQGRYTLRLLDRKPRGELPITLADLSTWVDWLSNRDYCPLFTRCIEAARELLGYEPVDDLARQVNGD